MLADGKLDAVSVALPNFLHAEVAIAAMRAGLNVLCEKPMAMNAQEAEAMLQVSRDPRTIPPIEDAARVLRLTGKAPLNLSADSEQLRAHIADFAGRNVFFDVSCRDRGDAEDIVRFVRDRSAAG